MGTSLRNNAAAAVTASLAVAGCASVEQGPEESLAGVVTKEFADPYEALNQPIERSLEGLIANEGLKLGELPSNRFEVKMENKKGVA